MIVEWGRTPERGDFYATEWGEDAVEIFCCGIMRRSCFHPEGCLGDEVAEDGNFES